MEIDRGNTKKQGKMGSTIGRLTDRLLAPVNGYIPLVFFDRI